MRKKNDIKFGLNKQKQTAQINETDNCLLLGSYIPFFFQYFRRPTCFYLKSKVIDNVYSNPLYTKDKFIIYIH